MARTSGYFSGPRDCMTGRSTVFANTMIALSAQLLDGDKRVPNPFAGHDVRDRMLATPLDRRLLPGCALPRSAVRRRQRLAVLLRRVRRAGDEAARVRDARGARATPTRFRCATSSAGCPRASCPCPRCSRPNYQGDPSWTQLGAIYLGELAQDRSRQDGASTARRMAAFIERDRNYLELYTRDGKPLRRPRPPLSLRRGHDLGGAVPRSLSLSIARSASGVPLVEAARGR